MNCVIFDRFLSFPFMTVKVFRFNMKREQPDVEQEEAVAAAMQPSIHIPDVGFRYVNYYVTLCKEKCSHYWPTVMHLVY